MKIRQYSDTHIEHYLRDFHTTRLVSPEDPPREPFWYPPPLPDDKETTLLLAGDIGCGTNWIETGDYCWIAKVSAQFKQVLIVLGNHDYWPFGDKLTIEKGGEKCNALLQDMGFYNVKVLDMDTYSDGDFLVVGATLWTDMFKASPYAMMNMKNCMAYDGKILHATGPDGYFERFTSERWILTHDKHKSYIRHVVENNPDKKIVVLTHHVPIPSLIDPHYAGDPSNAYYVSDLSEFVLDNPNIIYWGSGHVHFQSVNKIGECTFVNNCVGYPGEHHEQQNNVKHEVMEL